MKIIIQPGNFIILPLNKDGFCRRLLIVMLNCTPGVLLGIMTSHAGFYLQSPIISPTLIATPLKVPTF